MYYAAAYKHVHLVEENIIDGVENNIFGTINIIDLSLNTMYQNFALFLQIRQSILKI